MPQEIEATQLKTKVSAMWKIALAIGLIVLINYMVLLMGFIAFGSFLAYGMAAGAPNVNSESHIVWLFPFLPLLLLLVMVLIVVLIVKRVLKLPNSTLFKILTSVVLVYDLVLIYMVSLW